MCRQLRRVAALAVSEARRLSPGQRMPTSCDGKLAAAGLPVGRLFLAERPL